MTTANKTIKINDVEAAKILTLYLKEKFLLMPNLFSEY